MMSEIKYSLEDGEPTCSGDHGGCTSHCGDREEGIDCIPGLRQQRDDVLAKIGKVEEARRCFPPNIAGVLRAHIGFSATADAMDNLDSVLK